MPQLGASPIAEWICSAHPVLSFRPRSGGICFLPAAGAASTTADSSRQKPPFGLTNFSGRLFQLDRIPPPIRIAISSTLRKTSQMSSGVVRGFITTIRNTLRPSSTVELM